MSDCFCSDLIYDQLLPDKRALTVDAKAPDCLCSACSLSRYGPISLGETLGRFVAAPMHIHKRRPEVTQQVLTHASTRGMSVVREELASDEEVLALAEARFTKVMRDADPKVGLACMLQISARLVKAPASDNGISRFCLYDTENMKSAAHADVFQRIAGLDEAIVTTDRIALHETIKNNWIKLESYRNGLLMHLRPLSGPWAS